MSEKNPQSMTEAERIKYIDGQEKGVSNSYNIAGKNEKLDQTQVPLEILRFRVDNGRWLLDLEEISKNNDTTVKQYEKHSENTGNSLRSCYKICKSKKW